MRVTVIGTGYVGLTTGVSLAFLGHQVACVDVDESKIELLAAGSLPIYEPGLEELFAAGRDRLTFTTAYDDAVMDADVIFLAVGTPANEDGSPNLRYLFASLEDIVYRLGRKGKPTILVNKSTVPVGTGDQIAAVIREADLESRVSVASNPEFLRQGQAVRDTLYPERIVVGGEERAVVRMAELYAGIIGQSFLPPEGTPRPQGMAKPAYIAVDRRSAELAKYAANAFLAMKISFINEMANVCDLIGANIEHVADIIGKDPRIGPSFLQAGIGYGGSCFPKDTRALQYIADTNGYDFKLLSAVIEVNRVQKFRIVDKLRDELQQLQGKKIAVLGLTFKPGTDDMREAPSIPIVEALLEEGAAVYAHDPIAAGKASKLLPQEAHIAAGLEDALREADAALLLTEWPEYKSLDPGWLCKVMKRPLVIDGRNALGEDSRSGLEYRGIGIGSERRPLALAEQANRQEAYRI